MPRSLLSTLALTAVAFTPPVAAYYSTAGPSIPDTDDIAPLEPGWAVIRIADTEDADVASRLQQVDIVEDGIGLAVAPAGRLWRSTDGGLVWNRVESPVEMAGAVDLRADGVGLVADFRGGVARTTDGGLSWQTIETGTNAALGCVVWVDERTAITAGEVVLRSTDAGLTWSRLDVPDLKYYAAAFADDARGILVGGAGMILRTEDGGAAWTPQWLPATAMLRGAAWVDRSRAVVVGSAGTILRSDDGGRTWAAVASPTDQHLRAVAFHGEHGLIAGFTGTILRSDDGGRSWRVVPSGTAMHLFAATWTPDGAPVVAGWGNTMLRGPRVDATTIPAASIRAGR